MIADESALSESFIPELILHRDEQLKEIGRCLEPIFEKKSPESVFLIGPPGAGKTVSARWFLNKNFKEVSVYLNCWNHRSTHEILRQILLELDMPVHGRESTGELIGKLEKLVSKRRIVVCLDEVDKLKEQDVLYTLSRNGCGLILISNRYDALSHLNDRIDSRLALTKIEFPAYTPEEMFGILKNRAEEAFRPRSFEDELIGITTTVARGDARVGLQTLVRAGRFAEHKRLKRVTVEELRRVIEQRKELDRSFPLSQLNEQQRIVYQILGKSGKMNSGELYREYCRAVKQPVGDRAYRKGMEKMVRVGLIRTKGYGRWKEYEIVV